MKKPRELNIKMNKRRTPLKVGMNPDGSLWFFIGAFTKTGKEAKNNPLVLGSLKDLKKLNKKVNDFIKYMSETP